MKQFISKYILVFAVLAFGGTVASAQDKTKTETKNDSYTNTVDVRYYQVYHQGFLDNWSIGIMGGARVLFAEEDGNMSFGKRITPGIKLDLTKEITPDLSVRASLGLGQLNGWNTGAAGLYKAQASWGDVDPVRTYLEGEGENCSNGYKQQIRHFTVGADLMVNLWNVWTSANELGRKWNPYFILGAEYFQILKYRGYERTYKFGLHAGFKCDYNISKRVALTGEISESTHSATFDNEIGKGNRNDFYVEAMVGLKFRLGKVGYDIESAVDADDYARLQSMPSYVKETYDVPVTASTTRVVPSSLLAPSVVFDTDKITYSKELQDVNLSQMAEYMKANPGLKIAVIGNNHAVSDDLAKGRAEVIRQKLIDKYGIDGSRLVATALDVNAEYNVSGNDQSVNFGAAE